ncbi:MAG TPA: efflux RND transporter periplasmic adaptor subunit [Planctomycetota bacterium]|nr:efflux RND transporter periplasmic adaptor subunit [Planctomycetota bacterium]
MQRFLSPTLLALLGLFTTSGWAQQPVFVEPLRSESTQATERLLGSLRARSTSVMAALEEGVLLGMDVREGRTVAQGDVLAVLDARRLTAERAKKQADLAMGSATLLEREARLSNSELDLRALEQAASTGAISDQDLRNAKTQVAIDRAQLEAAKQANQAAQAELDLLDIRIQDCVVRAPFAARIIARHAEVGQWVHQGDPLVTVISTGPLEAWLQVPERFMG